MKEIIASHIEVQIVGLSIAQLMTKRQDSEPATPILIFCSAIGQQDYSHERPFQCALSKRHGCALAVELCAFQSVATIAPHMRFRASTLHVLVYRLRLAIEKVIHHDDVMRFVNVRPRRGIAARDPDSCNARFAKDDAEEGQTSIAWRGRDKAAED